MPSDTDLTRFLNQATLLDTLNRPLRMRLAHSDRVSSALLLPQKIAGSEAVCGGIAYRVLCLATDATLPLKELIALPAALDFVTDRGQLRTVCGIVAEASAGDSDGGLASYHLLVRDALAIMEQRINTRVFRNLNEFDIVERILAEWRQTNPIMAAAFEREVDPCFHQRSYPPREFTMQYQESDAAFIRRLLQRRGIGWYFRAGRSRDTGVDPRHDDVPAHTLVLFNSTDSLVQNAAGVVRYHRDGATEERDTITSWHAARRLRAGGVAGHSWDYKNPQAGHCMAAAMTTTSDQGSSGNVMAASLDDYRVLPPHAGADNEDLARLGQLRMHRHDLDAKCFHGAGSVRDFCTGQYFTLAGHPDIDTHPAPERDFVITALEVEAQNNLPAALAQRVARLFAGIGWNPDTGTALTDTPVRFRMRFTAVRRGVPIVPAFDQADVPRASLQSAVVVGPQDEEVHCDALGRVKIRFPATRAEDHADGGGASDSPSDSAWVRVASNWAGNGPGALHQCGALGLPRVGAEVLVDFLGADPDKPVIVGQLYNQQGLPPALSERGDLPGNRYLSGIRSREIHGDRGNLLRFDDSRGQISVQLASDHGASQVNLGWLSEPRADGHGEARGEGAELRSDRHTVVRGAQGVLVTAAASGADGGQLLDRDELSALSAGLQKLAGQLSALAQSHAGDAAAGPELAQLIDKLKQWHTSSAPIVAVGGPDGVIVAGGQNLALGAGVNADLVSGGATVLSSGAATSVRAARGLSLFAHQDGAKLTAASGKVQVQAQDDGLELLAKKVLDIISTTDWINLKAKQGVRIHGGGSELVIDAGGIRGYTAGNSTMHAASHQTLDAKKVDADFPGFKLCPSLASGAARAGEASTPLE